MCGIIGYIGKKQASPILINGLKRLEYRGYDSVGLAVIDNKKIKSLKLKGKISQLIGSIEKEDLTGNVGLAHTRWATHGEPSEANAHPHFDCHKKIAIVHNGIIENFSALKELLKGEGHHFVSQTDSEVLAHLIEKYLSSQENENANLLETAVRLALQEVEGTYGLAVISADQPNKIVVAKKGSPLVIGVGENEHIIASDASAIVSHTKDVIYLEDDEIAVLTPTSCQVKSIIHNNGIAKKVEKIHWKLEQIEKGGFESFMLKEIFEQPESITNAFRGRLLLDESNIRIDGLDEIKNKLTDISRIIIVACGTSWHAGLVGEFLIEKLAKIPVEVEYASEFRYREPVVDQNCLVIAISQSGETADTLAALCEAKERGALTFGICNVVGSSIARKVGSGCYIHAGPEIGVASTKAFTSQLTILVMIAIYLARFKNFSQAEAQAIISELIKIPGAVNRILDQNEKIKELAGKFSHVKNCLYLGRGINFPVALEGALKLKEISYIHAEGYPAAEMKHGPIALIDKNMPVVFIATHDKTYDKVVSNILEVKARGGVVIALVSEGNDRLTEIVDEVIHVPRTIEILTPILNTIPLQLLAYHIARIKGHDVDKPRNLAKSVTVE